MTFVTFLNTTVSWLTLASQVFILVILICLLTGKLNNKLMSWIGKNGVLIAAIFALASIAGSLSYSDIVGYEPCKLCWWQRIFMYPQLLLLGVAAFKSSLHKQVISFYGLWLSGIGAILAFGHYLLQRGVIDIGCEAVGYSVSCAKVFTMNLGYITIPLMAFTAFVVMFLSLLVYRNANQVEVK